MLPAVVGFVCLLPALLALRSSAGAVGAGPWDSWSMVAGGHLPATTLLAACPLLGALAGLVIYAWHPPVGRTNDGGRARGSTPGGLGT